jgi:uncharacterized surface protein with fasciclin (FAS1) repeats
MAAKQSDKIIVLDAEKREMAKKKEKQKKLIMFVLLAGAAFFFYYYVIRTTPTPTPTPTSRCLTRGVNKKKKQKKNNAKTRDTIDTITMGDRDHDEIEFVNGRRLPTMYKIMEDGIRSSVGNFKFTKFLEIIRLADMKDRIGEESPSDYILFAPTDEAFCKLSPDISNAIFFSHDNQSQLQRLVAYHAMRFFTTAQKDQIRVGREENKIVTLKMQSGLDSYEPTVTFLPQGVNHGIFRINDTVATLDVDRESTIALRGCFVIPIDGVLLPPDF